MSIVHLSVFHRNTQGDFGRDDYMAGAQTRREALPPDPKMFKGAGGCPSVRRQGAGSWPRFPFHRAF